MQEIKNGEHVVKIACQSPLGMGIRDATSDSVMHTIAHDLPSFVPLIAQQSHAMQVGTARVGETA